MPNDTIITSQIYQDKAIALLKVQYRSLHCGWTHLDFDQKLTQCPDSSIWEWGYNFITVDTVQTLNTACQLKGPEHLHVDVQEMLAN